MIALTALYGVPVAAIDLRSNKGICYVDDLYPAGLVCCSGKVLGSFLEHSI